MTKYLQTLLSGSLIVMLIGSSPVLAQSAPPLSSHEAAARELVRLTQAAGTAEAASNSMISMMSRQNPEMMKYQDVFQAWFKKIFSEGDLEGEIAKLYTEYYSEKEIKELLAFYRSDLGKKMLKVMPEFSQKSMMLGAKRAEARTEELKDMLREEMKRRESLPGSQTSPASK
jgi:uncharacterized protein